MSRVTLREVEPSDVGIFYRDQSDPQGQAMAAFKGRDLQAHDAHWRKILADPNNVVRTIVFEGSVAGNVTSWLGADRRLVGYWVSRQHWGRGIATEALSSFLQLLTERPLYAIVATHNVGSIRVLEKCGFEISAGPYQEPGDVEEMVMVLSGR